MKTRSDTHAWSEATLTSVTEPEFPVLRELAETIWRRHYAGIVSAAQIEYMLAGRFSDESLRAYLTAADRWLELLRVSSTPVGYCCCELCPVDPAAMKLGQLYVLESHRGQGLGKFMLGHVEARARGIGRKVLFLQVNKKNAGAMGFYRAMDFTVSREAVFDIGGGYVMDDYVMQKNL